LSMSSESTATRPTIVIDDALPGVIELRATGVVALPELREAYRELGQSCARRSDLRTLLFDAEAVTRFGRGAVVEAARWITRNARFFDRAVTITRSPSLKSAVLALSACAPTLRHEVVSERGEALAKLRGGDLPMTG
jgi:hypothetical protein